MHLHHLQISQWLDRGFVEELYGTVKEMHAHVRNWQGRKAELPVMHTELGPVLAEAYAVGELLERFDRRSGPESRERKRKDDFGFEPLAKIYQEFCSEYEIDLNEFDFNSKYGRRLHRELLLYLKDRGGLKYREIAKLPEFSSLKMNALGALFRYAKMDRV
jgi:hypothetical protein